MAEILTQNEQRLTLFANNIVIDKKLIKWRHAEMGLDKTEINKSNSGNTYTLSNNSYTTSGSYGTEGLANLLITTPEDPDASYSDTVIRRNDVDSDVNAGTKWLPLYEVAEGVSFDDLAAAGMKDLTRMIAENKLKFVIGGYGSLGSTQSDIVQFNSNTYNSANDEKKVSFFDKLLSLFVKKKKEEEKPLDALAFFSMVKLTSKESASTYRDRVSTYLKAVHDAASVGQTALMENLLRGMVTSKYEAVLYSEGLYYVVTEQQIVDFVKKCEKGIKLDYIKNFTRPLPSEVIERINKINNLEIFDNYVVLYYDPDGKIYQETAHEEAKRRDPILFGVIAGSNKLYYIADWVDEYCDLTLEKFIDVIGVKKNELHMDYDPNKKVVATETPKKKKKNRKNRK